MLTGPRQKKKQTTRLVGRSERGINYRIKNKRTSRQPKNNMHGCVRFLKGLVSHVKMLSDRYEQLTLEVKNLKFQSEGDYFVVS